MCYSWFSRENNLVFFAVDFQRSINSKRTWSIQQSYKSMRIKGGDKIK
jgi:hypothetical protein